LDFYTPLPILPYMVVMSVHVFSRIYKDVLPCITESLPSVTSSNDVFLKLMYNDTMATKMSKSVCDRFPCK